MTTIEPVLKGVLGPASLGALVCDASGVPLSGRVAEYAMLRAAGRADASLGRLFEGHVNALQLIGRFGTREQHARATRDAQAGRLFGVWNTQGEDGVRVTRASSGRRRLSGGKTFGSGAGRVSRAIVTAAPPQGAGLILLVPMDEIEATIDRDSWHPLGMHDSESFDVSFEGTSVAEDAVIGQPGDYERAPWFAGGASRFLVAQTGALEAILDELAWFLRARGRDEDPIQLARFAECAVAVRGAILWVDACVAAWERFDQARDPGETERSTLALLETVDAARVAVENAALTTLERVERSVGARGLLESLPFARMIRDQRTYLRQPAPDAALLRAGRYALARSIARAPSSPRA